MGRGEYQGYVGNMSALIVSVGPLIFGYAYAAGRSRFASINVGYYAAALL